ncbi:SLATT domain-containing protein [Streptomyces collinus]|uniref:SLATT domain-containing protein n=1 Tax=Streptomyces collinus TaxID=42684 RepID=UPI000F0B315A|nr:SLATT domain-containing protein [Streptomyces collinus]UJA07810.1 SLATT domain-containing protein [Streptomyces collinus]UJA17324.1 SLATT domain-containing protein [Streptomyces collinus]
MTEPANAPIDAETTDVLIQHRRNIADLKQRIRNRHLQVLGLYGTPIVILVALTTWVGLKISFWLHSNTPDAIDNITSIAVLLSAISFIVQAVAEFSNDLNVWRDRKTPVKKLRLELSLAEERHVLEARRRTPPPIDRQATYRERLPGEIARLRQESRYYRRIHLFMQWMLFISSAAISAVTAWYDPPQPAKGALICLGFAVTVITAAAGYFKPRERAFNLQLTADSIEQNATALELGIPPYDAVEEKRNLALFATTVEDLRAEQRMREQQLDQPQQGQQQVI